MTIRSRPANLDALLLGASDINLALTADSLATRAQVIARLTRQGAQPTLRHLVLDTRVGDREALVAALQDTLGAASIVTGERRLVVLSLAEDMAPCPTMLRCIKNLMDAHGEGARFVLSCPTPALAYAFRTHCMHVHCWRDHPNEVEDARAPFREAVRALMNIEDEQQFWTAARAFALRATTSCMPVRVLATLLVDVAPRADVVAVCAECEHAWRKSGDACTAFQAALVLTKRSILLGATQ